MFYGQDDYLICLENFPFSPLHKNIKLNLLKINFALPLGGKAYEEKEGKEIIPHAKRVNKINIRSKPPSRIILN